LTFIVTLPRATHCFSFFGKQTLPACDLAIRRAVAQRPMAMPPEVLTEIANLVATGALEFDVAVTYPLDQVANARVELERRHTRTKSFRSTLKRRRN
jgi:NADPH:quinone reductase-like Zn-dependent oxidoreductase